jgi:hypothetical protein
MNAIKQTSTLILVGILFLGSVCVNVFAHFCKQDGTELSLFTPPAHACETEIEIESSCCHAPSAFETHSDDEHGIIESDCCQETNFLFKIATDFSPSEDAFVVEKGINFPLATIDSVPMYDFLFSEENSTSLPFLRPPPSQSGREIFTANQQFRI